MAVVLGRLRWAAALPFMADLWMAGALISLSGASDWRRIGVAAATVVVRTLVMRGLARPNLRGELG